MVEQIFRQIRDGAFALALLLIYDLRCSKPYIIKELSRKMRVDHKLHNEEDAKRRDAMRYLVVRGEVQMRILSEHL